MASYETRRDHFLELLRQKEKAMGHAWPLEDVENVLVMFEDLARERASGLMNFCDVMREIKDKPTMRKTYEHLVGHILNTMHDTLNGPEDQLVHLLQKKLKTPTVVDTSRLIQIYKSLDNGGGNNQQHAHQVICLDVIFAEAAKLLDSTNHSEYGLMLQDTIIPILIDGFLAERQSFLRG